MPEPRLQRVAGTTTDDVKAGARPVRQGRQKRHQGCVRDGKLRLHRDRNKRAVVVEQHRERGGGAKMRNDLVSVHQCCTRVGVIAATYTGASSGARAAYRSGFVQRLSSPSRMSDAQPKTLRPATTRRIARIRVTRSSLGIYTPCAIASAKPSISYGLTMRASWSSRAAPASVLKTSTPSSSSRAATNSLATRFIPSASELTTQNWAR